MLCVLQNEVALAFKQSLGFLTFCFQLISIKIQAQYYKKKHLQDVFLVTEKRTSVLQIVLGKNDAVFNHCFSCDKNVSVLVRKHHLEKQSTCQKLTYNYRYQKTHSFLFFPFVPPSSWDYLLGRAGALSRLGTFQSLHFVSILNLLSFGNQAGELQTQKSMSYRKQQTVGMYVVPLVLDLFLFGRYQFVSQTVNCTPA